MGREFHCFTALQEKQFFLISIMNLEASTVPVNTISPHRLTPIPLESKANISFLKPCWTKHCASTSTTAWTRSGRCPKPGFLATNCVVLVCAGAVYSHFSICDFSSQSGWVTIAAVFVPLAHVPAVGPTWAMSRDWRPGFAHWLWSCAVLAVVFANGEAQMECGTRSITVKTSQSRIVGGRDAVTGAWPWQVSLQMVASNTHMCGASVINQYWLLSAAHCFPRKYELNMKTSWQAVIGLRELSKPDRWTITRKLENIVLHEKFVGNRNDVAVLKVDQPISFGDYIRPACLPKPGKYDNEKWTHCHVTGWGLMEQNGKPLRILQEARVELIPSETCQQSNWYDHAVDSKMICAGFAGGGIDACQGDSGGPLSCQPKNSNRFYVVGIVSWGEGCAQRFKPGVYASASDYGEWIEQRTGISIPQGEETDATDQNENGADVLMVENQTVASIAGELPQESWTQSPISMVHRDSLGLTIPLLNQLLVFSLTCISHYS
ncbi:acrosin-like [Narcine bancroftii]|uniref:acrosin-like n=1 Tax=Narcine bancroftii TaxID=1343680 RepID=UPI003831484A